MHQLIKNVLPLHHVTILWPNFSFEKIDWTALDPEEIAFSWCILLGSSRQWCFLRRMSAHSIYLDHALLTGIYGAAGQRSVFLNWVESGSCRDWRKKRVNWWEGSHFPYSWAGGHCEKNNVLGSSIDRPQVAKCCRQIEAERRSGKQQQEQNSPNLRLRPALYLSPVLGRGQ